MKRLLPLMGLLMLAAAGGAGAAERGLDRVEITPREVPDKPEQVAQALAEIPAFTEVAWNEERGWFEATVVDSARLPLRPLLSDLEAAGVDPETVIYDFAVAFGQVRRGDGFIVSPVNEMDYPVLFSRHSLRLWGFLGKIPGSYANELKLACRMLPGAVDESGAAAPDTADVIRFELVTPIEIKRPR